MFGSQRRSGFDDASDDSGEEPIAPAFDATPNHVPSEVAVGTGAGAQPDQPASPLTLQSYLWKKSSGSSWLRRRNWLKRWVELDPETPCLRYSTSPDDAEMVRTSSQAAGRIPHPTPCFHSVEYPSCSALYRQCSMQNTHMFFRLWHQILEKTSLPGHGCCALQMIPRCARGWRPWLEFGTYGPCTGRQMR